jgi:gluconolactonase
VNVFRLLASLAFPLLALVTEVSSSTPIKMEVERLDPAIDELIPANTKVEKLAEGFVWSEGPTWFEGSVLFSDVPDNVIYRWKPDETSATVFMKPSGLFNFSPGVREPGSNGLAVDADGRQFLSERVLLDGPLPLAGIYDLAQFMPKAYMPPGKRGRR